MISARVMKALYKIGTPAIEPVDEVNLQKALSKVVEAAEEYARLKERFGPAAHMRLADALKELDQALKDCGC